MKTHVIRLDLHDDLASVRDRMAWAKTGRILLVFPWGSTGAGRSLDLHLLDRHARSLGAELAIAARRKTLVQTARKLGIPVFPSAASAQRQEWIREKVKGLPARRDNPPDLQALKQAAFPAEAGWRSREAVRLAAFSLAAAAILSLLVIWIPSAQVTLVPEKQIESLEFEVLASPQVTAVTLAGRLPAGLVQALVVTSRTIPTTGSGIIPADKAVGTARFRNLGTSEVVIPAGTVIYSQELDAVKFQTLEQVSLEAKFGSTVETAIQAVMGGKAGNLPADALTAVEGGLGAQLAVTNPKATSGGTDSQGSFQTDEDRTAVREALLQAILMECESLLPAQLAEGDLFFPGTLKISQVLEENYFPAEEQISASLSLTMRAQCQGQYAAAADLLRLASMSLASTQPPGTIPLGEEILVAAASQPVTDASGEIHWRMQASRELQTHIDPLGVVQMVLGRRTRQAEAKLAGSLTLAEAPVIHMNPGWWPWMPLIPARVTLNGGGG